MAITSIKKILVCTVFPLSIALPATSHSAIINFEFTGNIMVASAGTPITNTDASGNPILLTPISASLNYNTVTGLGGSDLSITMQDFFNYPATFHDITMQSEAGSNLINASILVDWNGNSNMPMNIEWDATGFLNATSYDLKAGDTVSGSTLKQDTTGDGVFDTFNNVFSATPYSDTLLAGATPYTSPEGPAPLAATAGSLGLGYDINGNSVGGTPFDGVQGLINIGSGNSLTVLSVTTVPVPAAIWLFGSGLLGLLGVARRRECLS